MNFRISARHSDLARLQAYRVGDAIKADALKTDALESTHVDIQYQFRASLGDMNLTDPLWKMPEKGVFTEDFIRDLTEGSAEMVVHSWKDLPTELRSETEIAATLPRADVRDLFLFRKDRFELAKNKRRIRVLTSSPRRAHNLEGFLKSYLPFEVDEVVFENVRGNIPTRLKKLIAQDVDGLVVAKAALDRLLAAPEPEFDDVRAVIRETLLKTRFMVLPLTINPTAAAQGALAVEISKTRADVRSALQKIHCHETFASVSRERAILSSYGGGCHQKIGVNVLKRSYGDLLFLRGLTDRGEVLDRVELTSNQTVRSSTRTAASESAVFPRLGEESTFFVREPVDRASWSWVEKEQFLWVARESAWPQSLTCREDAVIWTAGLKTWKNLARRGVWISGSAESLGESEATLLEPLLFDSLVGGQKISWVKLTHESAEKFSVKPTDEHSGRVCATYRLIPKAQSLSPVLAGRTHFFWMSASSFERALELNPWIRDAHHSSGPGSTHAYLLKRLGPNASVSVFLCADSFRKAALGTAEGVA